MGADWHAPDSPVTTPPDPALRVDALRYWGVAAIALFALSPTLAAALGFRQTAVAAALTLFALAGVAALSRLAAHAPQTRFGVANAVTLTRLTLTCLVAMVLVHDSTAAAWFAVLTASTALALDGLDGWLARRAGISSRFGAWFDMETDALLIALIAVLVWRFDKAGAWVLLAGLARYLFVAAGARLAWMRRPLPPSRRRKIVCVVQSVTLLVALAPVVPAALAAPIAFAGVAALLGSFARDVQWLAHHATDPHPETDDAATV